MSRSNRLLAEILKERQAKVGISPEYRALEDIFAEEPVSLDEFVRGSRYMKNPPLSLEQYNFVRHFEQVLLPETYPLMVEEFGTYWNPVRYVNYLAAEWGKGGGKDHTCRVCIARTAYLLMCLKSPQEYFSFAPQDEIHLLNVAVSAGQAHTAFFKPLRTLMTTMPWFQDKFSGELPGPQATSIRLNKQLELISGHSNMESLEGLNLIAAIADEIAAFKTREELEKTSKSAGGGRESARSAEAILSVLETSSSTRFPESFKVAQISYPRYKGDAIEQAVIKGRENNEKHGPLSRVYVSGPLATWTVNPRWDKFERIDVPGATEPVPNAPSIIRDYEEDPATARAKYECKPELSPNRFFKSDEAIFAAFNARIPDPISIEYYWGLDEGGVESDYDYSGLKQQPGWQVKFHFSPDFVPMRGTAYAVHGDMAISGDRAGVAMCHVRSWERKEWEIPGGDYTLENRPIVKVDFVTSFEANVAAVTPQGYSVPLEVQIRWYRKLIWELSRRGFNVMLATFDNFQSADTIQILESRGIESKRVSMDTNSMPYQTLRDVMYDHRLEGYWRNNTVNEIMALTKMPNGKIDHPPNGSKDESDALAGAVVGAIELGGDEGEVPERADTGDLDLFGMGSSVQSKKEGILLEDSLGVPRAFEGLSVFGSW